MLRKNHPHRKEARRAAAEQRAIELAKVPLAKRILILDERLGEGIGAKKERAKLSGKENKNDNQ